MKIMKRPGRFMMYSKNSSRLSVGVVIILSSAISKILLESHTQNFIRTQTLLHLRYKQHQNRDG